MSDVIVLTLVLTLEGSPSLMGMMKRAHASLTMPDLDRSPIIILRSHDNIHSAVLEMTLPMLPLPRELNTPMMPKPT